MTRSYHHVLHVLLAGLVVLGGLPRFELRHAHEAHRHHDGNDHENPGLRHHRHDLARESDEALSGPILRDLDWHTHVAWLGGLAAEQYRPPSDGGDDAEVDRFPTPLFVGPKGPSAASAWSKLLALLKSLHGPPAWSAAESLAITSRPLYAHPDRGPSPPLCDRARHERSGVQLT